MANWFQKILFVVISLSFFISATEMDLGEKHNTFSGEFETYVKAENVSENQTFFSSEDQNACRLASLFSENKIFYYPAFSSVTGHEYSSYLNYNPSKLFLRNSGWRI